jgi:hypothetical protein
MNEPTMTKVVAKAVSCDLSVSPEAQLVGLQYTPDRLVVTTRLPDDSDEVLV